MQAVNRFNKAQKENLDLESRLLFFYEARVLIDFLNALNQLIALFKISR